MKNIKIQFLIGLLLTFESINCNRYYHIVPNTYFVRSAYLILSAKTASYQSCFSNAESDWNSNIIVIEKYPLEGPYYIQYYQCSVYTFDPWNPSTMIESDNSTLYIYGLRFLL